MTTDQFKRIFGTRRSANHSYWCEPQNLSRAEQLSARLGVPMYWVGSTAPFSDEIEAATLTEAARALLQAELGITDPTDDHVYVVVLAFMTAQPVQQSTIDALLTEVSTS